ncbi:MAG: tetratricopeptide repeat protein [Nitrospirota bacterium]|nr:tetratricopeptide repeat protein [Nitrospirota bacterium]
MKSSVQSGEGWVKNILLILSILLLFMASPCFAGLNDGEAALESGDYATALQWFRPLADQGDADAQYNLGFLYATGRGVSQDEAQAAGWYRKAADQGQATAQNNLGVLYATGRGVPQDYAQAKVWYRKAADQGQATAQYNLGVLYATGRGVPQDEAQAARWYWKAADQGQATAQYNLGLLYATGRGVLQDEAQAAGWYRKAADQGDADAQYNLGLLYATGRGVPQDYAQAKVWYRKAADQGHTIAQSSLSSAQETNTVAVVEALDEDLFTIHAIQYLYDTWPDDFQNTSNLVQQLQQVDRRVSALKAGAEMRKADSKVMQLIDDCRALIVAYETYLHQVGAIDNASRTAKSSDGISTLSASLKNGVEGASSAYKRGYDDQQSAGIGVAFGLITVFYEGYSKEQQRNEEQRSRLKEASATLKRISQDIGDRSKLRVESLTLDRRWAKGEAGLDGFTVQKMSEALARRPRDLFLRVRNAALRDGSQSSIAILGDAETCVNAYLQVPATPAFDEFRRLFLAHAAEIAAEGAIKGLQDSSYSSAPSLHGKRAVEIVQLYLSLQGADMAFGYLHLARSMAATGNINGAIVAANKVPESHWTAAYRFIYARLMSISGDTDRALSWLRSAFAHGHTGVGYAKASPDFKNVRAKLSKQFEEITKVNWKWIINWGFRINNDTITLRNNSAFPITNVILGVTVSSSGYPDWEGEFKTEYVPGGGSVTWKLDVSGITSRGWDYKGYGNIACDQC